MAAVESFNTANQSNKDLRKNLKEEERWLGSKGHSEAT